VHGASIGRLATASSFEAALSLLCSEQQPGTAGEPATTAAGTEAEAGESPGDLYEARTGWLPTLSSLQTGAAERGGPCVCTLLGVRQCQRTAGPINTDG
jgi:hypothetical protein